MTREVEGELLFLKKSLPPMGQTPPLYYCRHIAEMPNLSVPVTFRTVRFVTFVLFSRERTTTPSTVSLLFAHGFSSQIFILCLSKHAGLLKFLLHDSHGIRTSGNAHGGTDMQSLHDCSRLCVTSRLHPLLQPLKTYFFAIAHVIFVITW